ncbi:hypothetical protein [Ornithinimicrobium sp. Y1694]|uniref:hypothetical protein n=1 Tax=Ornithinimicrobium sp. Y1694 TaxID=3418590 RepID=UPI003CF36B73
MHQEAIALDEGEVRQIYARPVNTGDMCPRVHLEEVTPALEIDRPHAFTLFLVPADSDCELPLLEPILLHEPLILMQLELREESDLQTLDPGQDWLIVQHHHRYLSHEVGCGANVLTCDRPLRDPVFPTVDEAEQ